jgi:2-polyprenyl-3-methyl-5-hydroxy-6-metoxy-1,4-benzoquinol methylase
MSEYEQLKSRGFKDYSKPHQAMYKVICEMIRDHPADILEVGAGIGFGLKTLIQANCVKSYVGVEPDKKCFDYINSTIQDDRVTIINKDILDVVTNEYDFILCIEVIEHMKKKDVICMLKNLHPKKALFLSTPKIEASPHGQFTGLEITEMLKNAGFYFIEIEWQLPHTLYICEVK